MPTLSGLMPGDIVDTVCLVVILVGLIQGIVRGVSGELARLLSAIATLLLGLWAYRPVGLWLQEHMSLEADTAALLLSTFVAVILLVTIVALLLRVLLKKFIKLVVDQPADSIIGAVAGVLRCAVIVIIVFFIATMIPNEDVQALFAEKSRTGRVLQHILPEVREVVATLPGTGRFMGRTGDADGAEEGDGGGADGVADEGDSGGEADTGGVSSEPGPAPGPGTGTGATGAGV